MTNEPNGPYKLIRDIGIAGPGIGPKFLGEKEVLPALNAAWLAGRASRYGLRIALAWVLNDAAYKPPEEIGDVPGRWLSRLRQALAEDDKEGK